MIAKYPLNGQEIEKDACDTIKLFAQPFTVNFGRHEV